MWTGQVKHPHMTAKSAYFLFFVEEKLSFKETGADKQGNQLTAEENHDYCLLHEILIQNELMMAVGSLL